MLTATDRQLLHACRAKRLRLTEEQRATKKVTRAPHPTWVDREYPAVGTPERAAYEADHAVFNQARAQCRGAQSAEQETAGAITVLHIVEAEIRGLTPAHKAPSWGWLNFYRSASPESRARFDAWLLA